MGVKRILIVFGTRPEAIKMAPVIKELKKHPESFESVVVVTAQHREMLDEVLRLFKIRPNYDLNIMRLDQDLFDVSCNALMRLKEVFARESPDVVLVQGDTTTTFMACLAAFYLRLRVAHIEAGLRTYNKNHPFPEEINRRLTSHIADLHFAPTEGARNNLLKEGIPGDRIHVTGNTVIDALLHIAEKLSSQDTRIAMENYFIKEWGLDTVNGKMILVTGHRRESFGEGFQNICLALKTITQEQPGIRIVYPIHLNPHVQRPVRDILGTKSACGENIFLLPPLNYQHFVYLMDRAYLILTDSGGIQEEAPSLGKPVLVMRKVTERPEAVRAGTVKLVGTDQATIVAAVTRLLNEEGEYEKMARTLNPYGDGKAANRISELLR